MNVLVLGGGGREHALAWKLAQATSVSKVFVAPGNAGTATEQNLQNANLSLSDFDGLVAFARDQKVELTVVGPEVPLVEGIVDRFEQEGLRCFGPSAAAAQLEGSKDFCKAFLERHQIPTAAYESFSDESAALAYVQKKGAPIVVKADGLAAGKGVIVAETLLDAENAVRDMLSGNAFGDAGCRVVIEDFLEGEEASFIVISDGVNALPMATSQDHKRIGEGDTGPNTGGMGAYSPAPVVTDAVYQRVMDEVIEPTIRGMREDGAPYVGFLYAGLMIDKDGAPYVIEFNCRFGDPETQPIMMRLQSDLADLCLKALDGDLGNTKATWDPRPALGVVLAAAGYPGDYEKGYAISGLNEAVSDDAKVFHAGTRLNDEGMIETSGGRVLCVTALGNDIVEAQQLAYRTVEGIAWDGMSFRQDIGWRAVQRYSQSNLTDD